MVVGPFRYTNRRLEKLTDPALSRGRAKIYLVHASITSKVQWRNG